jgi:hypothetical protein
VALVDDPDAAPADPGTGREGTDILDDQPPVTVGQYFNPIEAYGHRMALEQAGVRAWVCDEHIGATYGVAIGTKLQVRAGDEAAARAILEMDSAAAPADLWSDMPDDVVEPPEAAAPTRPEPEAAAPEEPSVEQDRALRDTRSARANGSARRSGFRCALGRILSPNRDGRRLSPRIVLRGYLRRRWRSEPISSLDWPSFWVIVPRGPS